MTDNFDFESEYISEHLSGCTSERIHEEIHNGLYKSQATGEPDEEVAPAPLSILEFPEQEDCSSDAIPPGAVNMKGKKKILVPELITMKKVLFDRYRLDMYTFLNNCLRRGRLSSMIGQRILNRKITREQCDFKDVTFWRIDRENFYADVSVELTLDTVAGQVRWSGYLVCWCGFDDDLFFEIEELTESVADKNSELDMLDSYLIPYTTNKHVDEISEAILETFQPNALTDPKARNAVKLAQSMGLKIEYRPVYEHGGVKSIVFFKEQPLEIGEDRVEKGEDGKKVHRKAPQGERVIIAANTIVINTNKLRREYSAFFVCHECYHFQEHYLFFRLQEMGSNDFRQAKTREIIVDEDSDRKDPIYFMEKQADRGAYGMLMPATDTRKRITTHRNECESYQHAGELFEFIGKTLHRELGLPDFRIRARMIQMGNIEAKGALNYVRKKPIRPFAFDRDSLREDQHTFVVEETTVSGIRRDNAAFEDLMSSGKYVYADGHVVINDEKYVKTSFDETERKDKRVLTAWAEAHVDECCLRFSRQYIQIGLGRYVFGRMYCDKDYLEQTKFFLSDLVNSGQMDELDAKYEYKRSFPKDFREALDKLRKKRNISLEKMAEMLCMDDSTFKRWLKDSGKYRNEDFLTLICLILELPDWISDLLFRRAGTQLDEDDRRQRALLHILRAQSADGIEAANAYLKENKLSPLSI